MTLDEYQISAMRTANDLKGEQAIIYGAFAITGEAGEYSELVKKMVFHGHTLDFQHFKQELGDVLWGIAYAAMKFGWSLDDVAQMNVAKLKSRYPEGFSTTASVNRVN
jgi:NTP pyrophosphatase (non-canonical NTP hydrolase)